MFTGGCNPASPNPNVPMKAVYRLNLKIQRWSNVEDMLEARMNHSACAINDKLYVFGGIDEKNRYV